MNTKLDVVKANQDSLAINSSRLFSAEEDISAFRVKNSINLLLVIIALALSLLLLIILIWIQAVHTRKHNEQAGIIEKLKKLLNRSNKKTKRIYVC